MKSIKDSTTSWLERLTKHWVIVTLGLASTILTFTSLLAPKITDRPDTISRVLRDKHLKVGYIPYFDIASKEAESGRVSGFLIDLLYKVADALGIPESNIQFFETDWQNFMLGLNDGKYDLSIAGTFITPEREQVVAFSRPIFHLGNGALVKVGDNRFASIEDFNRDDITIAVVQGEQGYEYAKTFLSKPKIKILSGPDLSLACLEVEKGIADAALSDQYILRQCIANNPNVKDALANSPYYVLPVAWATRKNDSRWLSLINEHIEELENSGWLRRLRAEYGEIPFASPRSRENEREVVEPRSLGSLVRRYASAFISGIMYTLLVSVTSIILGTTLGGLLALILVGERSGGWARTLQIVTSVYINVFLSIPALVLIIILYYNGYISNLSSLAAAIIALSLNLSPFAAKIIASGIRNIPPNYIRAAEAMGYSNREIAFKFKLPLVRRNSMQPLLVQWFTTIKLSSLASVIGVTEILHRSQQVIRETYQTEASYFILVVCYMVVVIPISILADYSEKVLSAEVE